MAQEKLIESNEMLQTLFQASPVAIIALDLDGRVTLWNQAAERIFGWTAEEATGRSLPTVPDSNRGAFDGMRQRIILTGNVETNVETTRCRKNGALVDVSLSAAPIRDAQGVICGSVGLLVDISERKRTETELAEARRHLVVAREAERLHVAHDLHDRVVQQLLGLRFRLSKERRQVTEGLCEEEQRLPRLHEALSQLDAGMVAAIASLRGVISDLRPAGLEDFGLPLALEGYIAQLLREYGETAPEVDVELDEEGSKLPHPVAICLFRVAQEALRNALHHAGAERIHVTLDVAPTEALLDISDDGCGFTPPLPLDELARASHFGIIGMHERVEMLGGNLIIRSHPGDGT
ncbi:MAG: PAS domain-containing sensor histidine kinase, partial [Ardenticatenaceae bacterium]